MLADIRRRPPQVTQLPKDLTAAGSGAPHSRFEAAEAMAASAPLWPGCRRNNVSRFYYARSRVYRPTRSPRCSG